MITQPWILKETIQQKEDVAGKDYINKKIWRWVTYVRMHGKPQILTPLPYREQTSYPARKS